MESRAMHPSGGIAASCLQNDPVKPSFTANRSAQPKDLQHLGNPRLVRTGTGSDWVCRSVKHIGKPRHIRKVASY